MSDIDSFLNSIVPHILVEQQTQYPIVVVGTRAVNAYLPVASAIRTEDWDVAYIGDEDGQRNFAEAVKERVQADNYKVEMTTYSPSPNVEKDIMSFRSRSWIRLSVNVGGDANITFLDVYRIPKVEKGFGSFIVKDGLLYSDLGFLFRELNRSEYDASRITQRASTLTNAQIISKLHSTKEALQENFTILDMVDANTDEITESLGQVTNQEAKKMMTDQLQQLEQAKRTLMRVVSEREALFGVVANGKISKLLASQVCDVCRSFEDQYEQYKGLKEQCESIRKMC